MRTLALALTVLMSALLLAGCGSGASEEYREVVEADRLTCWVRVAEMTYAADSPPDGELVAFECLDGEGNPASIPLATTTMEAGGIETDGFGVVKMEMSGTGLPGVSHFTGKQTMRAVREEGQVIANARFYMTPSQIRDLKEHLGLE